MGKETNTQEEKEEEPYLIGELLLIREREGETWMRIIGGKRLIRFQGSTCKILNGLEEEKNTSIVLCLLIHS